MSKKLILNLVLLITFNICSITELVSQVDTLLFKNKFCKKGTVILVENPDTTSIFLFVDNVTQEGVSGIVLLYGKHSIQINQIEKGIPINNTTSFKNQRLYHLRFYYRNSPKELSLFFNKHMKLRNISFLNGLEQITSITLKKKSFIVIQSGYYERIKYRTRQKDKTIDFILKELEKFGVINGEYNFVGTKYNKSKQELDYLYSLKRR